MSEIADLTYNVVAFTEIMQMLWKRLNDHGKNWRHVYKALVLLEYLIKTGSERVAQQCKENIFAIQTLKGELIFKFLLFNSWLNIFKSLAWKFVWYFRTVLLEIHVGH